MKYKSLLYLVFHLLFYTISVFASCSFDDFEGLQQSLKMIIAQHNLLEHSITLEKESKHTLNQLLCDPSASVFFDEESIRTIKDGEEISIVDAARIMPFLLEYVKSSTHADIRAPRPDVENPTANNAIVGKAGDCDLTPVIALLNTIKKALDDLTLNCEVDLSTVFTALDEVEQNVCRKFQETWTILDNLTFTCTVSFSATVTVDFSEVFTAIAEVEQSLCEKFQETWTILDTIQNIIVAGFCNPTPISQSDIGVTTFTISSPGLYTLNGDIVFSPITGQPAIEITSDNVILDLCGQRLRQGNSTANVDGIRIQGNTDANPRTSVTVRNGLVRDFTRAGITAGTNSVVPANTGCQLIALSDLSVLRCGLRAIEFLGTSEAPITDSSIVNCNVARCCIGPSADFGIYLKNTLNIRVQQSSLSECGVSSSELSLMNVETSTKFFAEDLTVICNTPMMTFTGIRLNQSSTCFLEDCKILNNETTESLTGISLTGGTATNGNTIEACVVANNTATNGPLHGIELLPFVRRALIQVSRVSNNLVTGAVARANCIGYEIDQATVCALFENRSVLNQATGDGTTNIAAGFNIGTSSTVVTTGVKNSEFIRNTAFKNDGFNDARSFGFRVKSNNSSSGNTGNVYITNAGIFNGPSTPLGQNQITGTAGAGSDAGGVPNNSIKDISASALNNDTIEYSNIRIS